jgi:predicted DNA-binding ribbon-helix-helix protein
MQTTIRIPDEVHRRLKDFAADEEMGMGRAIEKLLDEHARAQFWAGVAAQVADADYLREADNPTHLADAEEYIQAFEAAGGGR